MLLLRVRFIKVTLGEQAMFQDDQQTKWQKLLEEAGITDELLLGKTNELIEAIESGKFKPRNKERELKNLEQIREALLFRIKRDKEGKNG